MRRLVQVVQAVAVLAAVGFVVLLFANEPEPLAAAPAVEDGGASGDGAGDAGDAGDAGGADGDDGARDGPPVVDAASLFDDRCASCHGPGGSGGFAPPLSQGRAAARFPDIEDQIDVVTNGRGGMPAFGGRLTEDEIRAVVAYSRTL